MGCKSSKTFKEKGIGARSSTLVDARPTSSDFVHEKPLPPTPKKSAPTKKGYGAGDSAKSSHTNTYMTSGTNPTMNPIFFPAPTVDPGPSYSGGCDNSGGDGSSGGGGGYSGGCDSGGGGYSGGCDSGGGFSSSSF